MNRLDVHRQSAVSPIAELTNRLWARSEKQRLNERRVARVRIRVAFSEMVATTLHPPWVTEEAVTARSPRNLLQDNPRQVHTERQHSSAYFEVLSAICSFRRRVMLNVRDEVTNALYWDLVIPRYRVTVEEDRGLITLYGKVERGYQETAQRRMRIVCRAYVTFGMKLLSCRSRPRLITLIDCVVNVD